MFLFAALLAAPCAAAATDPPSGDGCGDETLTPLVDALTNGSDVPATPDNATAARDDAAVVPDDAATPDVAASPADKVDTGGGDSAVLEKPYWRRNFFGRFFSDQKYLFTTWLPSEVHNPRFILPVSIGTVMAVAASRDADASQPDLTFERDVEQETNGQKKTIAREFTTLGDGPVGMALIGTAYLVGRWSGHDRFAATASLSAEAVLDTGLWVTILKGVSARTRPSGGGTGQFLQYHPPAGQQNGSFPSGHASGAFAAASVFAGMYKEDHPWVPWLSYGTATLVGASRIALGRHFPTDVIVGAFIGDSFGRMVVHRNKEDAAASMSEFTPIYDPATRGEGMAWEKVW